MPPLDSDALNSFKNGLEMRKLCPPLPPKLGGQELKEIQPVDTTKPIPEHPQEFLVCCYYSPKMICRTEGDIPIAL